MTRNINYPLLLGGLIVFLLVLISFFPELFTSNDPLFEDKPKFIEYKVDGEWVEDFSYNPMRPNRDNLLGTDDVGRDIYARLIYGTRNTLKLVFLIALFRMLIALPLGLAAGMGIKFISEIIKIFNTFFTAIPTLIFSYIVLNFDYFKGFEMDKAIIAYTIVLTLLGWSKLAGIIEDNVRRVMSEDFIEGEFAIGKNKLQIAFQNIIPHIIPSGISLFFKEMAMAMFLIAQLAVLYVFVGVTRRITAMSFRGNYDMILEPEWGGSLSRISENIGRFETSYWMSLYPVLAFSIGTIGLNLLGEGLRIEFTKRDSRVISLIKRLSYHLSPRLFIGQIKGFKSNYKPILIKALIVLSIVIYFSVQWHPSSYEFDLDMAKTHIIELSKPKYQGRLAGSQGGYLAGQYIIDTLESYGLEVEVSEIPLSESSWEIIGLREFEEFQMPKILSPLFVENGQIKLKDESGQEKTFYLYKDFTFASIDRDVFLDQSLEKVSYKGIAVSPDRISEVSDDQDYFPISGESYYLSDHNLTYGGPIKYHTRFYYDQGSPDIQLVPYAYNSTIIVPFGQLKDQLASGYLDLEITYDLPQIQEYPARNISAILPGRDKSKDQPGTTVIIGAGYDGVYEANDQSFVINTSSPAINLELARVFSLMDEPFDKTIKFVFWDNENERHISSNLNGSGYFNRVEQKTISMALNSGYYYIDVNKVESVENDDMEFMLIPAQRADGNSYLIGLDMEKRFKQLGIDYKRYHYWDYSSNALRQLRLNALTSLGIGKPYPSTSNTDMDTMDKLSLGNLKDIGQMIVDVFTMDSRIME